MRTLTKVALCLALVFGLSTAADARRTSISPQKMRSQVAKYYQQRGLTGDITARTVGVSSTGKSRQVAVANNANGTVRLFNVHRTTGKVSRTPTGLVKQSTARGTANLQLRRERSTWRGPAGSFSGVNSSGLSKSGRSLRINSATDRNETVYVNVRSGKTRRFDGPYHGIANGLR